MDGPSSSSDHLTERSVREYLPDLPGRNPRIRTLPWMIDLCWPGMVSHGTRVSTLVTRSHHGDRVGERASGCPSGNRIPPPAAPASSFVSAFSFGGLLPRRARLSNSYLHSIFAHPAATASLSRPTVIKAAARRLALHSVA